MTGHDEPPGKADKPYRVLIDDNFHFMDEGERTTGPTFATYREAVAWCRKFLEDSLREVLKPGMSPAELVSGYKSFGEDPWITPEPEGTHFSAWGYVEEIAGRLCAEAAGRESGGGSVKSGGGSGTD